MTSQPTADLQTKLPNNQHSATTTQSEQGHSRLRLSLDFEAYPIDMEKPQDDAKPPILPLSHCCNCLVRLSIWAILN